MSKPEIFRRCLGCGVSVRTRARFCPQCGRVIAEESPPAQSVTTQMKSLRRASDREAGTGAGSASDATAEKDDESEPAPAAGITPGPSNRAVLYSEKEGAAKEAAANPVSASVATSEPLRQNGASEAAPSPPRRRRSSIMVEENVMPHVEKIRETSLIMFDEASDDPGMRFVLIAVALFLIFLLFLLISNSLK